MKAVRVGIVLFCAVLFQIVTKISKSKANGDFDYEDDVISRIFEAWDRMSTPPELEVYLRVDTREKRFAMNISLPIDKNYLSFVAKNLDLKRPLVFLIHGYLSRSTESWLERLSTAYLKRRDAVVFIVDWDTGSVTLDYVDAAEKTHLVARELVDFIQLLNNQLGVQASNIHLIGHSLGAHIAGFVGKSSPHINRITGLDPANPNFPENSSRLSKGDAEQVDVVHTSAIWGSNDRLGDVDFYINGGETQPGCKPAINFENIFTSLKENGCSHHRAITYFIESIDNTDCNFIGSSTIERAEEVSLKEIDPEQDTVLGLDTFKYKSQGEFHIVTNDRPPYCRN